METVKITRQWLKILLIIPLVVAFSFTSVAFAQEGQQQGQPTEWEMRHFATMEQRQQARQRDLTALEARWCNADEWVMRGGETLGHIVLGCNIALANILAVNPQISNPDLVFSGEIVRLPTHAQRGVTPGHADTTLTLTAAQQEYFNQFVTAAEQEGIPVTGAQAIDIANRTYATGSERRVAQERDLTDFDADRWCNQDTWVVMPGESLGHIVINCGIPLDVLLAHNPQINNPDIVIVGERINIPADPFAETQPFLTAAQLEYLQSQFDVAPADTDAEEDVDEDEEEEEDEDEG